MYSVLRKGMRHSLHHRMEITIRRATPQDADNAARLFQAHLNWINVWFDHQEVVQRPALIERQRSMFLRHPCVVAESDGNLVGFLCSEEDNPRILDLWNLYVDDPYRGRGIGTRLVQEVEKIGREEGIDTIMATVSAYFFPEKKLPESLFRRLGYDVQPIADGAHLYIKRLKLSDEKSKKVRRLRFSSNELFSERK